MICRSIPGARCTSSKQKDCQLVVVGAGVVVPVVYHCTLHWPHTHNMHEFAREPTQTSRLTNGRSKARDSMLPEVLKPKPSAESFGCCALTTRTEYRIEDNTPPLAVPSAEVSPKRCTSAPATSKYTKWCTEIKDGLRPSSRKMFILLNGNTITEPP